jgi:hypothetical protein
MDERETGAEGEVYHAWITLWARVIIVALMLGLYPVNLTVSIYSSVLFHRPAIPQLISFLFCKAIQCSKAETKELPDAKHAGKCQWR